MNKLILKLSIASASILLTATTFAADTTAQATAVWDASAKKDTTSALVVTPMKSLSFNYAEGLNKFNTQDGAFDVTIKGQSGASDFKLTSKVVRNTLTRSDNTSTLGVGVAWNGQKLSKTDSVALVDTANNINSGLEALAVSSAFAGNGRTSTQGKFTFSIDEASNGTDKVSFKDLADGVWDGEVAVQFNATWVKP